MPKKPTEYFAVVSEEFFGAAKQLHYYHAGIYLQLRLFYRLDSLQCLYNSRSLKVDN